MSISQSELDALRVALMQSYNSQTITHAGYIIALTVGLLTIISRWSDLQTYFQPGTYRKITLLLILSCVFGLILYFSFRVIFWATLSDQVMLITENGVIISGSSPTYISALQNAALNRFESYISNNPILFLAWLTRVSPHLVFALGFLPSGIFLSGIFWKGLYQRKLGWIAKKIRLRSRISKRNEG
jgi:hypothetical protein